MPKLGDLVEVRGRVVRIVHLQGDDFNLEVETTRGDVIWFRGHQVSVVKPGKAKAEDPAPADTAETAEPDQNSQGIPPAEPEGEDPPAAPVEAVPAATPKPKPKPKPRPRKPAAAK